MVIQYLIYRIQHVPRWLGRFQVTITALEMQEEVCFPHGTKQQVFMCNPTLLPSLSFSVHEVTKRKQWLRSRKCFVCCSLRSMNQLLMFSGPSGDNFRVIPHLPTALDIGIKMSEETAPSEDDRASFPVSFTTPSPQSWLTSPIHDSHGHKFIRTAKKRLSHSFHAFFWHVDVLHISHYKGCWNCWHKCPML
jgi:hypothetical protein